KRAVFREMYRVLKPDGRVAVSDIALRKQLPAELAHDVMAYVGCIAGAIRMSEYEQWLKEAGFWSVQLVDTKKDLNAYSQVENQTGCCSPVASSSSLPVAGCCGGETAQVHGALTELMRKYDVNDYAASVQIYALKG